jgi:archaemetzincin
VKLALLPFGEVDSSLLAAVISPLSEAFGATVVLGASLPLPTDAFDAERNQWLGAKFVAAVARARRRDWRSALGVTAVDLFSPELNFVFGQASMKYGAAVMSTARLGGTSELWATEAVHELGHTFGLQHCTDRRCVMWFSDTVEESIEKGHRFCAVHAKALREVMG